MTTDIFFLIKDHHTDKKLAYFYNYCLVTFCAKILVLVVDLKKISIDGSAKTPQIDLNHLNGELIFSGRSIPENAAELYEDVLSWVHEYIKNPRQITNLRLNLEYFNTASSIWLAKIVKALSTIDNSEDTLLIHLYFNIEEFDSMGSEDIKDALSPIIDIIGATMLSIGVKIYGTDPQGQVMKESMVLI